MVSLSSLEYFVVLLLVVLPTAIFTFHPKTAIRNHISQAFLAIILSSIPFLAWDVWATMRGHWGFSAEFTTGLKIGILPIEEILFFYAVPWSCLFLWNVIRTFTTWEAFKKDLLMK